MKKLTLEATDENILKSIKQDVLQRSGDVKDFICLLDTLDYNAFISIDAPWGDGKTFFVRQIEMTMDYYNKRAFNKEITEYEKNAFETNHILGNLKLQHTYLPVYYNAWLYDNHDDPLMSLIFIIAKEWEKTLNTKVDSNSVGDKILALLSGVSLNVQNIGVSIDVKKIKDNLQGKDILESIKSAEEIRGIVKEIFDAIITERAERLVIFIDELDRCRPSYAVDILECIKHYFDDDRIMFVMSVNKAELIHTISRYYGDNFDSSLYLNKFFDINIQLPQTDTRVYFDTLGISCNGIYHIKKFANQLQKYYVLSLRDTVRFFQKITSIHEKYQGENYSDSWWIMFLLIPIICVLDIVDTVQKNKILSGNGFDILEKIISENGEMRRYIFKIFENAEHNEENYKAGLEELRKIYEFGFKDNNGHGWYEGNMDIDSDLKNKCLRICNNG